MPRQEKSDFFKEMEAKHEVEVETSYDGDKVYSVKFNFTNEVWADLSNKEGNLLAHCCANVSAMRDCFVGALREDGKMSADDMQILVVNMAGHEYEADHPATKVKEVYEDLLEHFNFRSAYSVDHENVRNAVTRGYFNDIWEFCGKYGSDSMMSSWAENARDQATHNLRLHEIIPTVRTLYNKLAETKFPPIEAYGLVRLATNQLYEFRVGQLAVFDTKNEAERLLKQWIRSGQVGKDDAKICTVRISLEKGLEFIEEITNPFVKPVSQVDPKQVTDFFFKLNELRTENEEKWKNDKVEVILLSAIKQIQALSKPGIQDDDD